MHSILHGDCLALLPTIADNSIDAILTDPPYCLSSGSLMNSMGQKKRNARGFMNKAWDDDIAFLPDVWRECLRVLKPGGHIAVFGGSRTHHRVWVAVEDAGFELRDTLMWLYGSGFPKSLDVSKAIDKHLGAERGVIGQNPNARSSRRENGWDRPWMSDSDAAAKQVTAPATPEAEQWQGFGTALKPSHEPILLARKPLIGTVAQNVLKHGTGALNIDASRVPANGERTGAGGGWGFTTSKGWNSNSVPTHQKFEQRTDQGRWPSNLLHDGSPEVTECFPVVKPRGNINPGKGGGGMYGHGPCINTFGSDGITGSASRFFPSLPFTDDERRILYCPKASHKDRAGSLHPTIKPIRLIEWLCKLVCPPGGTILDPFAGSGTTGQAAINLGYDVIMIERETDYYNDILKRVSYSISAD